MKITTILRREQLFLKRKFWRVTFSQMVSPPLYFVAFGMGLGRVMEIDGRPYLHYLIPGLLAMATIRSSYTSVSIRISIMCLHERSFECCLYSSTRIHLLAIGHILAGTFRGIYSSVFIVLLGIVPGVRLAMSGWLLITVILNSLIFSALDFLTAMMMGDHYDMNNFVNIMITPMSFPCGTFFSLDGIPEALKQVMDIMPLARTARLIREISFGSSVSRLSMMAAVLFAAALTGSCVQACYREAKV